MVPAVGVVFEPRHHVPDLLHSHGSAVVTIEKQDVGVLAYSPMQLGLLSGKLTMDRTFPDDDQLLKKLPSGFDR